MRRYKPRPASPFRYFHSSPELIRQVVMLYIRFPLSLRNVEDLLFERGYDLWALSDQCGSRCPALIAATNAPQI